jgi:D-alanine-D-alanine ligase
MTSVPHCHRREHAVSLASAAAVAAALAQGRYQAVRLTIGADGTWHHGGTQPPGLADAVRLLSGRDAVVPVVHGPHGEDGTLAALSASRVAPALAPACGRRARTSRSPSSSLLVSDAPSGQAVAPVTRL